MTDHPGSAIAGISLVLKFDLDPIYSFGDIVSFITGLHQMQTRSSDENSVRLNVRPSVRPFVRHTRGL